MNSIDSLDVRIGELESSMTTEGERTEDMEMFRVLKMQRNSLTPFVALPEDVIIEVATYLLLEPSPSVPSSLPESPEHHILSVCRDVRRVLVSTSLLWVYIDLRRSIRWCELCVERSGAAALSLSYCPPQLSSEERWSPTRSAVNEWLFLELLPRMAHVSVRGWSLPARLVNALCSSSWPLMQTLDFGTSRLNNIALITHSQVFSSLRTLRLEDAALLGGGTQFPLLQHLEIGRSLSERSKQLVHTLYIVDRAPALRSLVIYGYYPCTPDSRLVSSLDVRRLRSLDMLRVELDYVDTHNSDWTPFFTFLDAFHAPRKECAVRFARTVYRDSSQGDWVQALMKAAIPSCTMHIHLLPDLIRAHRVALAAEAAGTRWTIEMERCEEPKWLPEDMLALVKTLHVGKGSVLHLFRGAASHLWPNALPSVQHVLIKGAQSELGYLKQWLHVRVYAGWRVHTVEFCASLVYPDAWELAVLKQDIVEMKLAKVVIMEDGGVCTVPEG